MKSIIQNIKEEIELIPDFVTIGKVSSVQGLLIEAEGLEKMTSIGSRCEILARDGKRIISEVVGIKNSTTLLMPFNNISGIGAGSEVRVIAADQSVYPSEKWLGRVVNAFGEPIDDKGPLIKGKNAYHLHNPPPPAHKRKRIGEKIDMGIRTLNTFLSCCEGQRMGIFAGSGVGKSMMLAMLTKFADTDIKVIGLIGERGREVHEFIEDYLGEEGLSRAVVVVATSDESSLTKKQAAYLTMTLCEYYRDLGMKVLCLMDSVTRFAMAHREIGLSTGEPPTTKGYTPGVFAELPKLLERAGPGTEGQGSITGLFSVLVEGDDHDEPISDAIRAILDGHIVLDRKIAARGIYPAIDILNSVSRTMPMCNTESENDIVNYARNLIYTYREMEDMIRIGAYKDGSDKKVDEAIKRYEHLDGFISQKYDESDHMESSYKKLSEVSGCNAS